MIKSIKQIRANITKKWNHPMCKFFPHQKARVNIDGDRFTSNISRKYDGKIGEVIAVTCALDGRIRGYTKSGRRRERTKYYVRFSDRTICSYDSNLLKHVFRYNSK